MKNVFFVWDFYVRRLQMMWNVQKIEPAYKICSIIKRTSLKKNLLLIFKLEYFDFISERKDF